MRIGEAARLLLEQPDQDETISVESTFLETDANGEDVYVNEIQTIDGTIVRWETDINGQPR